MSPLTLKKKLKPLKKTWRKFTHKLLRQLDSLRDNIPQTIKSSAHRVIRRFLTKPPTNHHRYQMKPCPYYYPNEQPNKSFAAIYIDRMYEETFSSSSSVHFDMRGASRSRDMGKKDVITNNHRNVSPENDVEWSSSPRSIEDAWKIVVARSPHLRGVDERADDFIHKFRQDMRVQKERSNLKFQEMLARST